MCMRSARLYSSMNIMCCCKMQGEHCFVVGTSPMAVTTLEAARRRGKHLRYLLQAMDGFAVAGVAVPDPFAG